MSQFEQASVPETDRFVRPRVFGGFKGNVLTTGGGGGSFDSLPPILVVTAQNKCRELTI
jgi:hypothetical protein